MHQDFHDCHLWASVVAQEICDALFVSWTKDSTSLLERKADEVIKGEMRGLWGKKYLYYTYRSQTRI